MKSVHSREITVGKALLVAWILLVESVPGARLSSGAARPATSDRPNILVCISDDQSWPHVGAAQDAVAKTPAFDRVAGSAVLLITCGRLAQFCRRSRRFSGHEAASRSASTDW